jgi:hypothetical protein
MELARTRCWENSDLPATYQAWLKPPFAPAAHQLPQLYLLSVGSGRDLDGPYRVVRVDELQVIHAGPGAVVVLLHRDAGESALYTCLRPEFLITKLRHSHIMLDSDRQHRLARPDLPCSPQGAARRWLGGGLPC